MNNFGIDSEELPDKFITPSSKKQGTAQHTATSPRMNHVDPSHRELYLMLSNLSIINVSYYLPTKSVYAVKDSGYFKIIHLPVMSEPSRAGN